MSRCLNGVATTNIVIISVVELEPDFLAGAGAGEKAPAPGCCCVTWGFCGGKVAIILIKFSHILIMYTLIDRKHL